MPSPVFPDELPTVGRGGLDDGSLTSPSKDAEISDGRRRTLESTLRVRFQARRRANRFLALRISEDAGDDSRQRVTNERFPLRGLDPRTFRRRPIALCRMETTLRRHHCGEYRDGIDDRGNGKWSTAFPSWMAHPGTSATTRSRSLARLCLRPGHLNVNMDPKPSRATGPNCPKPQGRTVGAAGPIAWLTTTIRP